jgi:hypothetical protein
MATVTDTRQAEPEVRRVVNFADELKAQTIGIRFSKTAFGVSKSLTRQQKRDMSKVFGSDEKMLSSSKKLLTKSPQLKMVTGVISDAKNFWETRTVPYPVKGVRLMNVDGLDAFAESMDARQSRLAIYLGDLDLAYSAMRDDAQRRLGPRLFNSADYPPTIHDCYSFSWEPVNSDPPAYLSTLSPKLFRREQQRVAQRFDDAVELAEAAFQTELMKCVDRMIKTLTTPDEKTGRERHFKDSLTGNLQTFFGKFRELSIGSNDALESVVRQTEKLLNGVTPDALRSDASFRGEIGARMQSVRQQIEDAVVARPKRRLR